LSIRQRGRLKRKGRPVLPFGSSQWNVIYSSYQEERGGGGRRKKRKRTQNLRGVTFPAGCFLQRAKEKIEMKGGLENEESSEERRGKT